MFRHRTFSGTSETSCYAIAKDPRACYNARGTSKWRPSPKGGLANGVARRRKEVASNTEPESADRYSKQQCPHGMCKDHKPNPKWGEWGYEPVMIKRESGVFFVKRETVQAESSDFDGLCCNQWMRLWFKFREGICQDCGRHMKEYDASGPSLRGIAGRKCFARCACCGRSHEDRNPFGIREFSY